jgi:hypothetical protein
MSHEATGLGKGPHECESGVGDAGVKASLPEPCYVADSAGGLKARCARVIDATYFRATPQGRHFGQSAKVQIQSFFGRVQTTTVAKVSVAGGRQMGNGL